MDLSGEFNSQTPVDVTFEALGNFRIGLSKDDFVLKRTVRLNQSEDVKIVWLEVSRKYGATRISATFNEEVKGALEAFLRFNMKNGVIDVKATLPTMIVNEEPIVIYNADEYLSDKANYASESDIALSDVVSVEIVGEIFSVIKNKTINIKGVITSEGKWRKYETGGEYMYIWFDN